MPEVNCSWRWIARGGALAALACAAAVALAQRAPTIQACDRQNVCATAERQVVCFRISLEDFTREIDYFEVDWDDGSAIERIPGSAADLELQHEYVLGDWGSCQRTEVFRPGLETFPVDAPDDPEFSGSRLIFDFPPQSVVRLPNDGVTCVGLDFRVTTADCNFDTETIDFGDGAGPGTAKTHVYSAPGVYTLTHQVVGECGEASSTTEVTVLERPAAVIDVTEGVTVRGDPLTVCLSGGTAQVVFTGANSAGAQTYRWSVSRGLPLNQGGRGVVDTVTFTRAGTYTLFLTVDNACREPARAEVDIEVVDAPRLALAPQPDRCEAFAYTPSPRVAGATYEINGTAVSSFPFQAGFGAYEVVARLSNECGDQELRDAFTVAAPADITVVAPAADASVCLGSDAIALEATPAGGTWSGAPDLSTRDGVTVFTPRTLGTYVLSYRTGSGACERTGTRTITVEDNEVTLEETADACEPIDYTPRPLLSGVTYEVDGTVVTEWPVTLDFGAYVVTATRTNSCGEATARDEFSVVTPAQVAVALPTQDTTVCAGGPAVRLRSEPAGGTWAGAADLVVDANGATFDPRTPGTYTLTYTLGSGACARGDDRVIVVEDNDVTLAQTADACVPIDYTPDPLTAGVTYEVNGAAVTSWPVRLGFGAHVVTASRTNACGGATATDAFEITAPAEVAVILPTADTTVCNDGTVVRLRASHGGGAWAGAAGVTPVSETDADFAPAGPGVYTLTYRRGDGDCTREDAVTVTVEGLSVSIDAPTACRYDAALTLSSPQAGGTWSSPTCPGCVTGDVFTFPAGGADPDSVYAVGYEITNATGCRAAASAEIAVVALDARFTLPPQACVAEAVTPSLDGPSAAQRTTWSVDGTESTLPLRFPAAGAYRVLATAAEAACVDTTSRLITAVAPPPPLEIVADVASGCGPLTVALSTSDAAGARERDFRWDFGRGPRDTLAGLTLDDAITFENTGVDTVVYRVRLRADNACGDGGDEFEIAVFPQPYAEIGVDSALEGCSPYRALFTNRGSRAVGSCRWSGHPDIDFADCRDTFGLTLTATTAPVTYAIVFEAANACGTDADTARVTALPPGVTPLFNLSDRDYEVCPGDTLRFVDASTPRPAEVTWDLGDGTRATGDTVYHVYDADDATYAVRMRATMGCGYAEAERAVRVFPRPRGEIEAVPSACVGAEVDVAVVGDAAAVRLDLGNGERGGAAFAKTTYDTSGDYVIRAQLTSAEGCRDSTARALVVHALPMVGYVVGDTVCAGQPADLRSTGNGQTDVWRLPDGAVFDGTPIRWSPPAAGTHRGTLVSRSREGCADSVAFEVFARATPVAAFAVDGDEVCAPATVLLTDESPSAGNSSYRYDLGDGAVATTADLAHDYGRGGRYAVRQIVGIEGLCFDTAEAVVEVYARPALAVDLLDERCLPDEAASLNVAVGGGEAVTVVGPGGSVPGGTRFAVTTPGEYVVTAVTDRGCDTSATVRLAPRVPLEIGLMPDTTIAFGDSLELWSVVNYDGLAYEWTPAAGLADATAEYPLVRPARSTTYRLYVTDGACWDTATVRLTVVFRDAIDAPTAFSPDGDGVNDVWEVFPNAGIRELRHLRVYNRWGGLVYQRAGLGDWRAGGLPLPAWDGTVGGEPLDPAVFVWTMEAEAFDGSVQQLTGQVTLMR